MTQGEARAILERLALLAFLILLIASIVATGLGVVSSLHDGDLRPVIIGLAGLLLALAVRPFGYKYLHFRKWADSLEPAERASVFSLDPVLDERAQAFATTLANLEALQQRIATGEADVWDLQQLRRDAAAMLAAEPALREVFAAELIAHPELA